MDIGTERLRPLHNFKMPRLKWGSQKVLRCMIVKPSCEILSADRRCSALGVDKGLMDQGREIERLCRKESLKRSPPTACLWGKSKATESDGIDAVREKVMFDLQAAADKMKDAILREGLKEEPLPPPAAPVPVEADDAVRPWNLRTRRAACKAPNGMSGAIGGGSGGGGGIVERGLRVDERRKPNFSPSRNESKSPTYAGEFTAAPAGEKVERSRFSVSLSRRVIEEDFRLMTGHRPPRRPKKRPKILQKELDTLFPGLWLTEVTADMYKVPDPPETGK